MKKASEIVSHIINQPQFRYLKKHECFKRYISLLPAKWQNAVAFMYIKDNTMFIATNHPAFKMELNYNKDLLTSILIQLKKYSKDCNSLEANKIIVFDSKYHSIEKKTSKIDTIPYYNESAKGLFEINTKEPKLKEKFENIKKSIKKNI
jgi:hypothetical protein